MAKKKEEFEYRYYQPDAAKYAMTSRKSKKILVVSPGASGKAVMIGLCVKHLRSLKRKKSVLVVTHSREIIKHLQSILKRMGESPAIIMGEDTTEPGEVTIASLRSLPAKGVPDADVLIIDEAHRVAAKSYERLTKLFSGKRIVGFSATPFRLDGKPLGGTFDDMYEAITPEECIAEGWIVDPTCYQGDINAPELRTTGKEYTVEELQKAVTKDGLVGNVVKTAKKQLKGRQAVLFAVSVEHSRMLVERFKKAHIKAVHVDGTMPVAEREQVISDFEMGKYQVICNCMLLSEGWDMPACDGVILCRPTLSLALYLQMTYRCMRPKGRFPSIVLDHTWNVAMHGLPGKNRQWSLNGAEEERAGAPAVRICKKCGTINDIVDECVKCGADLTVERHRVLVPGERSEMELQKTVGDNIASFARKAGLGKGWEEKAKEAWRAKTT